MFFLLRLSLWTIFYRTHDALLLTNMTCLVKVVCLFHVDQTGMLFIKKQKLSSWSYLFIHHPTRAIWYYPLEKPHALSLGYMLSSIKFCDPLWFYFIYAFDLRCYAQMNLVLLKYCLTMLFKKKRKRQRDEKMACQRSMIQKREREREKMACQRSMTQQIKSDMKRSMYLSVR